MDPDRPAGVPIATCSRVGYSMGMKVPNSFEGRGVPKA